MITLDQFFQIINSPLMEDHITEVTEETGGLITINGVPAVEVITDNLTTTEAAEIMSLVKAAVDIWAKHNDAKMGKDMLDAITNT